MTLLTFQVADHGDLTLRIDHLIIAGWAGRDLEAVEHHIAELEALGVSRPRQTPCFYRVSAHLLNPAEYIQVSGKHSSGEAEFVLIPSDQGLLVGLGSDHTDRKVESYDVTVSKQMCDKPIGIQLWRYAQVQGHWDQLIMRTWRTLNGQRELYQQGPVTALLALSNCSANLTNRRSCRSTPPCSAALSRYSASWVTAMRSRWNCTTLFSTAASITVTV